MQSGNLTKGYYIHADIFIQLLSLLSTDILTTEIHFAIYANHIKMSFEVSRLKPYQILPFPSKSEAKIWNIFLCRIQCLMAWYNWAFWDIRFISVINTDSISNIWSHSNWLQKRENPTHSTIHVRVISAHTDLICAPITIRTDLINSLPRPLIHKARCCRLRKCYLLNSFSDPVVERLNHFKVIQYHKWK